MYVIKEDGTIKFKRRYKRLYEIFYHSMFKAYRLGPKSKNVVVPDTQLILHGEGFLLHSGSPFIHFGVEKKINVTLTSDKPVKIRMYRMSVSTGQMVPILDVNYNLVDINLVQMVSRSVTIAGTHSVCIHSSDECALTVDLLFESYAGDKIVGEAVMYDCNDRYVLYDTVKLPNRELLDVVTPKFAPIHYLVQRSLDILSLCPPLLTFCASESVLSTHSCNMVYTQGALWSDFKGGSSSWSLDLKSPQTIISELSIDTTYSSSHQLGGTVHLKYKQAFGSYVDCDASSNNIRVTDIKSIRLDNIRLLKAYDALTVVVDVDVDSVSNILSSKCTVGLS